MRHQKRKKILSRKKDQRRALLKSLIRSFFEHRKIRTTLTKANAIRPIIERLINKAKNESLSNRRELLKILDNRQVNILFKFVAPAYKDVKSGFVRITKVGTRKGDGAMQAVIELTKKIEVKLDEKKPTKEKDDKQKPNSK